MAEAGDSPTEETTSHRPVSGEALWQWRHKACQDAQAAGIAPDEVDWLLQAVAGLDRLSLRLGLFKDQNVIPLQRSLPELSDLWKQRVQMRVPVQYLAGAAPWRRFSLTVAPGVLIPRPETECLIDLVAFAIKQRAPALAEGEWADLGTGSGAIALGLADLLPRAVIHAVDASPVALAIAQGNAAQHGFSERIRFYEGSWFQPLALQKGTLSGMVSNPPYIPSGLVPDLQPEVVLHEPHTALDGGADGLECIRILVQTAPEYLKPGGIWLIEMMAGQADAVRQLLQAQGLYQGIQIFPDLAGIDRFALAYRMA